MLRSGEKADVRPKSLNLTKIDLTKNELDLDVNLEYNIQNSLDIRKEVNNIFIREGDHFEETNFNEFHTHYHFHSREPKPSTRNEGVSDEEIEEMVCNLKTYDDEDLELPNEEENPDVNLFNGASSSDPPGEEGGEEGGKRTKYLILKFIRENPDSNAYEIADAVNIRRTSIYAYLHHFMDQKLLKRRKKERYVYRLTEKGENWIDWYEGKIGIT